MAKGLMDCDLEEIEVDTHSHYYVQYPTNTLRKKYELFYSTIYRLNAITYVLIQGWLWH